MEENSSASIKKAVIENQYLAVIPVRLVKEEIKRGKIHVIRNTGCGWDRYSSIVYHKNKFVTDKMKNLIDIVKNYKHIDILQCVSTGKLTE